MSVNRSRIAKLEAIAAERKSKQVIKSERQARLEYLASICPMTDEELEQEYIQTEAHLRTYQPDLVLERSPEWDVLIKSSRMMSTEELIDDYLYLLRES